MKSRRKTIPAYISIESNSEEVSRNGTPLRQMSITEAFKYSKPRSTPFKSETPFISSSVCYEVSDSDSETPELGLQDLPIKVEPVEVTTAETMEAPSPPKIPKLMIGVNKPGTPKHHQAGPSAQQGSRVGVQNTPKGKASNLFSEDFVSPASDTSERTIPYEYLEITTDCFDEATVPFPKNGIPTEEVFVMNDPKDFDENAVDSFLLRPNRSNGLQSDLRIQNTPNVSNNTAVRPLDFNSTENNAALKIKEKKCKRRKTKTAESKVQDQKDASKDLSQDKPKKQRKRKINPDKITDDKNTIKVINISQDKPKKQRKRKINTNKIAEDKNTVKENSSPNHNFNNSSGKFDIQSILTLGSNKKPQVVQKVSTPAAKQSSIKTINKVNLQPKIQPMSTFEDYILASTTSPVINSKNPNSIIEKLQLNKQLSVRALSPKTGVDSTPGKFTSSGKKSITTIQKTSEEAIHQTKIPLTPPNKSKGPKKNPRFTAKKIIAIDQQPCCSTSPEKNVTRTNQMTSSSQAPTLTSKNATTHTSSSKDTIPTSKNAISSAKLTIASSEATTPSSKNNIKPVSSAKQTISSPSQITTPTKQKMGPNTPVKSGTSNNAMSSANQTTSSSEATTLTTKPVSSAKQTISSPSQITTPTKQKIGPNSPVKSGSPRRKLFGSPSKQSPMKQRQIKSLKSKEGKQLQVKQMDELVKLFKIVKANRHLKSLLNPTEYQILHQFSTIMEDNKKYVLMKLFVWKRVWYNIFSFCQKAHVIGDDKDIIEIFEYLRDEQLVDTEYKVSGNPLELLDKLDFTKVKQIMEEFKIRPIKSKGHNVRAILAVIHSQSTLTFTKSLKDLVMDSIEKKMGFAIKIKQNVFDAFYYAYLLGTFTNPNFACDAQSYFKAVVYDRVVFPATQVEDYPVFYSREKFLSFAKALELRKTLEEQLVNKQKQDKFAGLYNIGDEAYQQLFSMDTSLEDHPLAPHLKRFTAGHVYAGILSTCCEHIFTKTNGRPSEVKKWIEFLLKKFPTSRRTAKWYRRLIWLHMRHLEEIDYEAAANLLIEVLDTKKHLIGEIDKYDLGALGKTLKASKRYKIDAIYHDRVAQLIPRPIDVQMFPQQQVDSHCIRSDISGKKRVYLSRNGGDTIINHVEQVALNYYAENGYPGGDHGEGRPIKALLMLFFWDIIYDPARVVPGTFISPIQNAPLDMFTPYFYNNRADAIDERLRQIDFQWSDNKVIEFAASNWQTHAHEEGAFGMTINAIKDEVTVEVLITVIGRGVLAKIFERLIKNLREFRSGMPDLLVWNIDEKKCKFVEVKGEGDTLSTNQKLWLQYLQQIGASVEVCHVHSMGSKRKKIQKCTGQDSPEKGKSPADEDESGPGDSPQKGKSISDESDPASS